MLICNLKSSTLLFSRRKTETRRKLFEKTLSDTNFPSRRLPSLTQLIKNYFHCRRILEISFGICAVRESLVESFHRAWWKTFSLPFSFWLEWLKYYETREFLTPRLGMMKIRLASFEFFSSPGKFMATFPPHPVIVSSLGTISQLVLFRSGCGRKSQV